jgi:hypothetical protein
LNVIDAKDQGVKANDVHAYHSIEIILRTPRQRDSVSSTSTWQSGTGIRWWSRYKHHGQPTGGQIAAPVYL